MLDQPRAVRPGEELDTARLEAFLAEHLPGAAGPVEVEQFPSGFSNLTYLLRAGERELVLRRPPFGASARGGHDMVREYRLLAALAGVFPLAPRPLALCEDPAVLGAPFYLMERVRGVILRARPPAGVELAPATMRGISEAFVDQLAELHAVDWRAAGLGDLGHPEGYVERQVRGWTERWRAARTDDVPAVERVAAWLHEHRPADSPGASLIHNDYKYDNVVLDPARPTRIVAVLDWEMATVGDPRLDLGTTLAYWLDPDDPPELAAAGIGGATTLPGNLRRAELAERYARRSGRDPGDLVWSFAYGVFKVAVIAQQIYARFQRGHTRDPRFAGLPAVVRALGRLGEQAIDRGRIDRLAG